MNGWPNDLTAQKLRIQVIRSETEIRTKGGRHGGNPSAGAGDN